MPVTIIILIIVIIFAIIEICIEDVISKITVIIPPVGSETFFHLQSLVGGGGGLVLETLAATGDTTAEWKSNTATEIGIADVLCAKKSWGNVS